MQRRILILGNSHAQAIKDNAPLPADMDVYWIRSKKAHAPGDIEMSRAYELAAELTPEDALVVMRLGTLHNVAGLLNHAQPFALFDGRDPGGAAELVPEAAMRAHLRDHFAQDPVLPRLRKIAACRIGHVMPPPPKRDLSALLDSGKAYRGTPIAEAGFAPARQRLAFWALERRVLSDHLRSLEVIPIGPPPETDTLYSADQTDAFAALDLSGPDALPALERLCTLDLAALQVHAAPRSLMAHLSVILIRLAPDAFRLMSARSSAKSFAHSIRTALSAVT